MPKKRHQNQFTKPQSTAPPNLASSSGSSGVTRDHKNGNKVNDLLAQLRRTTMNENLSGVQAAVASITSPSVPPNLRQVLQLPDLPSIAPRRRLAARYDASGRRPPAGPPAPRSWTSTARSLQHRDDDSTRLKTVGVCDFGLPGSYRADDRSFVAILLRSIVADWDVQRVYNFYHLCALPNHVRETLIATLARSGPGITTSDLKVILVDQTLDVDTLLGQEQNAESQVLMQTSINDGIQHLDLTSVIGSSMSIKALSRFLFPIHPSSTTSEESWDAPAPSLPPTPPMILPNLTHLSLALTPQRNVPYADAHTASWKELLAFASNLSSLTHLSLAYWPEPSLTPNAKFAKVTTRDGRSVQYGGTGPYSHSIDNDWSEATAVLRRLGKELYSLEWLDLTGCGLWFQALSWREAIVSLGPDEYEEASKEDGIWRRFNQVDWTGNWGNIETLILRHGYTTSGPIRDWDGAVLLEDESIAKALTVGADIRERRRQNKGKWIDLEIESR